MKSLLYSAVTAIAFTAPAYAAIVNYDFSFSGVGESIEPSTGASTIVPFAVTGTIFAVEDDIGFNNSQFGADRIFVSSSPYGSFEMDPAGLAIQTIGGEVNAILLTPAIVAGGPLLSLEANGYVVDPSSNMPIGGIYNVGAEIEEFFSPGIFGNANLVFTSVPISAVPLPATLPLMLGGLGLFAAASRSRSKAG